MPNFLNIGLIIDTNYNCSDLQKQTIIIEKKIGRVKSKKNSPRVCDIDIIDFNGLVKQGNLELPHPRCHLRNFVLIPLYEICKDWKHPKNNKKIFELLHDLKIKNIRSIKKL